MAKPRTLKEIEIDYNQKLHQLGNLEWQARRLIPEQIATTEEMLIQIQKEAQLARKVENQAKRQDPPAVAEEPQAQAQQ